jgi:hypothetical protein
MEKAAEAGGRHPSPSPFPITTAARLPAQRFPSGRHPRQEVRFERLRQQDPNRYEPGDEVLRLHMAKVILRDLVEQWKAQEVLKPVKVKPPTPGRDQTSGDGCY